VGVVGEVGLVFAFLVVVVVVVVVFLLVVVVGLPEGTAMAWLRRRVTVRWTKGRWDWRVWDWVGVAALVLLLVAWDKHSCLSLTMSCSSCSKSRSFTGGSS
jgi:hypothetical protein